MSKFMLIVGILLAAIGVALGLMTIFSPGPMQVYGLTAEVAAILLVGGILSMGLGGLVDSRDRPLSGTAEWPRTAPPAVETAAAVATATVAASAEEALSPAVSETIKALEKAKTDLQTAFEEKPAEPLSEAVASAEPEPAVEEAVEEPAEEEVSPDDDGQLYVLEERSIRGHAARLLSDGTVEAETSEGWMRFENLEHLDEYLDAMEPPRA